MSFFRLFVLISVLWIVFAFLQRYVFHYIFDLLDMIKSRITDWTRQIRRRRRRNLHMTRRRRRTSAHAHTPQADRPVVNRPLVPASLDHITETGPMVYFANDRHGREDKIYRFNFKKVDNGWRAYILRMPSLAGRSSDSGTIHRLHDSDGYYICWDRKVDTLKDMQIISRRWADSIQEYISTGSFG